ncbi:mpv17-like protein 2 [Drosophila teissieri]|uniref:mpv17-like protein 2 n=1 Tax=Drosophila teissieri TaxID=7243 RepID=UPI001CBA3D2A|nr:mpv17-like protein 2 [Drosophila teissieri]
MFSWTRLANPLRMGFQFVTVFSTSSQIPPNAKFWSKAFGKYLLLTNTVGSGLLVAIGDAVAQQYEEFGEKKDFDYSRSGCMMITGLVIGPVQHSFYLLLDRLLSDTGRWGVRHKILADQLIMSPTYIFLFFYVSSLLGGRTFAECNGELVEKFLYTWMLDCCFWPGLQYLNFRFLKSLYRVIFVNVANCVYVVLLSHIKYGFSNHDT